MSRNQSDGAAAPVWASQNFLTNRATIKRLLSRTTLGENDHVIEIGPGKGHTTGMLARLCRKVSAVEIDARLYGTLLDKFGGAGNVKLYRGDFLDWKLPSSGAYKVFANIPFSRTTAIVRKLTECGNPPREAWLTMEKGAAKRFLGSPRESLRSLMLKPGFEMEIAYHFLREDFHPKPGVDVVLLHLKKKRKPDIEPSLRRAYERFLSGAFCGRPDALRRMFTKKQLARALGEAGLRVATPGEILYTQWLCLFRCHMQMKETGN